MELFKHLLVIINIIVFGNQCLVRLLYRHRKYVYKIVIRAANFHIIIFCQVQLQWPTNLALNPLDETLHITDDRVVLKVTRDNRVKIVAGTPLHCYSGNEVDKDGKESTAHGNQEVMTESLKATQTTLGTILGVTFGPYGDLYIAQSDSRKINTIKVINSAGYISHFAGYQQTKNPQK